MLPRVGLAIAAVFVALSLAELGMRVVGVGQVMTYAPDPRFGYIMRPSQVISTYGDSIEINALGLRGPPILDPKPRGVVRILFLGDSITYGGGRTYEGSLFCRILERLAREDGFRVEAVNVSAPGWGPQNWTAWVEVNGLLKADMIVVVIPAIDRARPFATLAENAMEEEQPMLRLTTLWLKWREVVTRGVPLTDEAMHENVGALERLKGLVGARPLLAVFLSSMGPDQRPDRWTPYELLFPKALDLRAGFGNDDYLDAIHFSSSGHRIIGTEIYARLRPTLGELSAAAAGGGS